MKSEAKVNSGFLGCGVAITGSSCYNLMLMDKDERYKLLKKLYSKDGMGFGIGRLTVGSSDYSAEVYTYDDVEEDTELKFFSIERDREYIIPIIKEIIYIAPVLIVFLILIDFSVCSAF